MAYKNFFDNIHSLLSSIQKSEIDKIRRELTPNRKIFLIGNGGSMSICEHMQVDMSKRLGLDARALSSASLLTCLANDFGFQELFTKFLYQNQCNENDLLIAISSSAKSLDINKALRFAKEKNTTTIYICGFDGFEKDEQRMCNKPLCDVYIHFNSYNYGEVEMSTELLLHSIVEEMIKPVEKLIDRIN